MKITEKQFGSMYHLMKAVIYNRFRLVLKYFRLWSPVFIFLYFLTGYFFVIISAICFVAIVCWLGETKLLSLRNINYVASRELRKEYFNDNFK